MIQLCLCCFLKASKLFLRHLFASTFVSRTVSSTDNKYNKQNDFENKTFTFIQFSPLVQLGQKLVHGLPRQSLAHKSSKTESWVKMKRETPKIFPQIPALLKPLQAPPARFSPPLRPPAGLQAGKGFDLLPTSYIEICPLSHPSIS